MGWLIALIMGGKYDPEEDKLAAPNDMEADDLRLHVGRCALRYRQLRKDQHEAKAQSRLNFAVSLAALAIIALSQGDKAMNVLLAML